jgi:SPP1 gp7 family putative phage head morphogenesis protein
MKTASRIKILNTKVRNLNNKLSDLESSVKNYSMNPSITVDGVNSEMLRDIWSTAYQRSNPDPIMRQKGRNIYKRMAADDAISSVQRLKAKIALSDDWFIEPADNTDESKKIASMIEENLKCLEMPIKEGLEDTDLKIDLKIILENILIDKWLFGFKISEILYGIKDGIWYIKRLKPKYGDYIDFKTDDYGNLEYIIPNFLTDGNIMPSDFDKLIIAINRFSDSNWYGESDLREIYREWYAKDIITKFLNVFLEYRAFGVWLASFDQNQFGTQAYNDFKTRVENLREQAAMLVPTTGVGDNKNKPFELEFIQTNGQGANVFQQAIEHYDTRIKRHLLIPDKLGFSSSDGGSYALGKTHFDIFFTIINEIQLDICQIVNNQIIQRICKKNWANIKPPKFKFKKTEDVAGQRADIAIKLVQSGIMSLDEAREYIAMPKKEVVETPAIYTKYAKSEDTEIIDRINLDKVESTMNTLEKEGTEILVSELDIIEQKLMEQIQSKKILEGNTDDIKKLVINNYFLKQKINQMLLRGYLEGKVGFQSEAKKSGIDLTKYGSNYYNLQIRAFAATDDGFELTRKWIEQWLKEYGLNLNQADTKAIADLAQKSFYLAGNISNSILDEVKKTLFDQMHRLTAAQITANISAIFDKYQYTGGDSPEPYAIKTVVRTETTRQYNSARTNAVLDPDLQGFYRGAQYIATIDDRTTEYCKKHHMQNISISNPQFPSIPPPAHYNCRSLLIYYTELDTFRETWTKTPTRPEGF